MNVSGFVESLGVDAEACKTDLFSDERKLYIRAVFEGLLGPNYITEDEMAVLHHALTDWAMGNTMDELADRADITVFNHDWEFDNPN
jgi:hypothetical protein